MASSNLSNKHSIPSLRIQSIPYSIHYLFVLEDAVALVDYLDASDGEHDERARDEHARAHPRGRGTCSSRARGRRRLGVSAHASVSWARFSSVMKSFGPTLLVSSSHVSRIPRLIASASARSAYAWRAPRGTRWPCLKKLMSLDFRPVGIEIGYWQSVSANVSRMMLSTVTVSIWTAHCCLHCAHARSSVAVSSSAMPSGSCGRGSLSIYRPT